MLTDSKKDRGAKEGKKEGRKGKEDRRDSKR